MHFPCRIPILNLAWTCVFFLSVQRLLILPLIYTVPVVANGDNWSVGQRQLLCLGRVMLKRSQLLFMDEATASVDSQTDAVIQRIIREDFVTCTIISIAHRIPTVMDCDRVLVVDAGQCSLSFTLIHWLLLEHLLVCRGAHKLTRSLTDIKRKKRKDKILVCIFLCII